MRRRIALLLCAMLALAGLAAPQIALAETPAQTVSLSASSITLEAGGKDSTATLAVTVTPTGADEALRWVTSDAKVATVSPGGVVTAVGKGKCVIGVRGANTKWAKCYVTVTAAAPAAVRFSRTSATLGLGEKWQIPYAVSPSALAPQAQWVTTNKSVATVSATGEITATGKGACVIGMRVPGSAWAKCKITVTNAGGGSTAPVSGTGAVTFETASLVMNLGALSTVKLGFTVDPADKASSLQWVTTNAAVASVEGGTITAHSAGSCVIGARVPGGKWAKCKVKVSNVGAPTAVSVAKTAVTVAPGGSVTLSASVEPSSASQSLTWKSADPAIVTVDGSGKVQAVGKGSTTVRVASAVNPSLYKTIRVTVSDGAVTAVTTGQTIYTVAAGTTFNLQPKAEPASASQSFTCVSSNDKIATVDADGTVHALAQGKAVIRVYSAEDKSIYASVGVKVSGTAPSGISFSTSEFYFAPGDGAKLVPTLQPAGAKTGLTWKTSDSSVVDITSEGHLSAKKPGTATITVTTTVGGRTATVRVTVLSVEYTTVLPARSSGLADLKGNLARIDAIRESALNAVNVTAKTGAISASEASQRRQIVQRAFAMYRFPWMTTVNQPYWRASASLGGLKDFKAGMIYYGLPYIQCGKSGDFNARRFNEQNALSGGYYTDSGRGYYLMSQTKRFDGMYAGNDCSAFVSLAQWGLGNGHSFDYTDLMLSTYAYRTVNAPRDMRPGDLLVKSGHCVLFLYYTDTARTQMMIIEQGGGSSADVHNTVSCSVVNVTSYTAGGFIIRRQASFAG